LATTKHLTKIDHYGNIGILPQSDRTFKSALAMCCATE